MAGKHRVFARALFHDCSTWIRSRERFEIKRLKNESQCFGGTAEIFDVLRAGIKTLVRLPQRVFCTQMWRGSQAEAIGHRLQATGYSYTRRAGAKAQGSHRSEIRISKSETSMKHEIRRGEPTLICPLNDGSMKIGIFVLPWFCSNVLAAFDFA